MCGIAGVFAYRDGSPVVDRGELLRARDAMRARGPDGAGLWVSDDRRIGLAHRRLAIIDPSPEGAQPMATSDGRLHITFNGEIYNYLALRRELEAKGYCFRSQSDTEVLLHLYADRGAEMVHALRGMYAFAVWDALEQRLFLARDPLGIKPLYYADDGSALRFASQVKALLAGGAVDTAPEPAGSVGFLIWGTVPEPFTLYRGVLALPAGTYLELRRHAVPVLHNYFNVRDELLRAQDGPPPDSPKREALAEALRDSVAHHLVSDVPIGVFLSAGVDSAVVAALAAEAAPSAPRAFTLGFEEFRGSDNDEVPLARNIAAHLGAPHETAFVSRKDFQQEIHALLSSMDQPSIDGVNTYFVSRAAARGGMKVALSGLGGDELLGGYSSFKDVPRLVRWLGFAGRCPALGRMARNMIAPLLGTGISPKYAGLAEYAGTYGGAYLLRRALFAPWETSELLDKATVQAGLARLDTRARLADTIRGVREPRARVAALEFGWYLRNQLLRDADWAGMAHSLEIRVPLVDSELFRALAPFLARPGPPDKQDAVASLRRPLPEEVVRRPKTGFVTPVRDWIEDKSRSGPRARGLRGWALRVLPSQPPMFRALALVPDAFGGQGGIAQYNRDLLNAVGTFPRCAGLMAVPRHMANQAEPVPPHVAYCTTGLSGKWKYATAVARCLSLVSTNDVVVCAHINLLPLAYAGAKLRGARLLLLIYGIEAWQPHRNWIVNMLVPKVDHVVSISSITASRFSAWSGISPDRINLLPNGIDMNRYGPGARNPQLAERYRLDGKTVLMTMGRLERTERYKGFDEVLDALPVLLRRVPNLVYLVAGEGPDRDRLQRKAASLGIEGSVVFTGWVPEQEKAEHFRLADLYVMPSYGEGFGYVLLEAMACGVPVVASRVDGGREAVRDGLLGELVDPRNQAELIDVVLRSLGKPRGVVPSGLEHFSSSRFVERAHALLARLSSDCTVDRPAGAVS